LETKINDTNDNTVTTFTNGTGKRYIAKYISTGISFYEYSVIEDLSGSL